jgi:hypothetical protein
MLAGGALVASALALSACTQTRQFSDIGFRPPEGRYRLLVMRPDVSVGLLTAGGQVEPRADWTTTARTHLLAALEAQQGGHGGAVKVAGDQDDLGIDPDALADLEHLHRAVGTAIRVHKYGGLALPTKQGRFDWTLGETAVRFGVATRYDYALFLHAEDSFSSSGPVALQAVSLLGCAVGVCMMPHGGQQAAFASLVDLKTGKVVWFNTLSSSVGDIRTPEGAGKMIEQLLARMKPAAPIRDDDKAA